MPEAVGWVICVALGCFFAALVSAMVYAVSTCSLGFGFRVAFGFRVVFGFRVPGLGLSRNVSASQHALNPKSSIRNP